MCVCSFFQSQAASQEALDQIKAANEASLRSQLEQRIRELEGDLGRARSTQQDSLNQKDSIRTELEQYRQLYSEEMRIRKSLTAKLERLEGFYCQLTIPVALHRPETRKSNDRQLDCPISVEGLLLI